MTSSALLYCLVNQTVYALAVGHKVILCHLCSPHDFSVPLKSIRRMNSIIVCNERAACAVFAESVITTSSAAPLLLPRAT